MPLSNSSCGNSCLFHLKLLPKHLPVPVISQLRGRLGVLCVFESSLGQWEVDPIIQSGLGGTKCAECAFIPPGYGDSVSHCDQCKIWLSYKWDRYFLICSRAPRPPAQFSKLLDCPKAPLWIQGLLSAVLIFLEGWHNALIHTILMYLVYKHYKVQHL